MPLYEYECQACQRRTEKIQKFSDVELTECPHCGGLLERTLTAPAVHFAGGGWYKDLYSSAKPPAAGGGEASGDKAAGGKESGKSEGSGTSSPAETTATSAGTVPAASAAPSPTPAKA